MIKKAFLVTCIIASLWLIHCPAHETSPVNNEITPVVIQEPDLNKTGTEGTELLTLIDLPDNLPADPDMTLKQKLQLLLEYIKIETLETKNKIKTHLVNHKTAYLASTATVATLVTAYLLLTCCKKKAHEKQD